MLENIRSWTIAHEIGHQWWHAMVGNDSTTSPAVDEPLAQYSACVVFRAAYAEVAETVCTFNTTGTYQQMRMLGIPDTAAAQASDAFDSSLQYGGVVYGKAPGLYLALDEAYGAAGHGRCAPRVRRGASVRAGRDRRPRDRSGRRAGRSGRRQCALAAVAARAHGDEDIGVPEGDLGSLDDLLGGGDTSELEDLLDELLGTPAG